MVYVVDSIYTAVNFIFCWNFLKPIDLNSGLECKFDLEKNQRKN